jgi:hypothetical protein
MWLFEIYSVNSSDEYLCSLTVHFNMPHLVVFSVEITLSGSHSGNSFEFSHRLTGFLNYALFCLSYKRSLSDARSKSFSDRQCGYCYTNYPCHTTVIFAKCDVAIVLANFLKSSPLKSLGQMNRNLVGSILGRDDSKSLHCLWQGELKSTKGQTTIYKTYI